jgi:glycosyltransferase involved in cell wall biosynthesis
MKPLVSIIIPCFNRELVIYQTLDSIIRQTYNNWECIIVDDGSSDNTISNINNYCKEDNRFKIFSRPEDIIKGPSSCRNFGLQKTIGDYVVFLDSDDLLAPFCIEERIEMYEKNKDCDFLVFQMEVFKNEEPDYSKRTKKVQLSKEKIVHSFIQLQSEWQITAPIYTARFIKNLGGFNKDLNVFEDIEIAIRAIFVSRKYKIFNNIDCYYRNNEDYFSKHKEVCYVEKTINSFYKFCQIFDKEIVLKTKNVDESKKMKSSLVMSYKLIFNQYITPYRPNFFKQNSIILSFLMQNDYLSKSEKLKFSIIDKLQSHLYNKYFFGWYRLINFWMK